MLLTLLARFSAAVNHALAFDLSRIMPYLSQLRIKCIGQCSYHLCLAGQSKALPKKLVNSVMPARGHALKCSQDCKALAAAGRSGLQPDTDVMSSVHISWRWAEAAASVGAEHWSPCWAVHCGVSERQGCREPASTRLAGG